MTNKQALNILKERYEINSQLIEDPESDFDNFILEENQALEVAIRTLENEPRLYRMKVKYISSLGFKEIEAEGIVCGSSYEDAMNAIMEDYYYDDNIISITLEQYPDGRTMEKDEIEMR